MVIMNASRYERIVIDRYAFTGLHGCASHCGLEIDRLIDGRWVVVATELEDNPGTSVTNAFEIIATVVCRQFDIDPLRLVWIEHYGYPSAIECGNPRTYDLVQFGVACTSARRWHIGSPVWKRMQDADWEALGLEPRQPVEYRQQC